MYVYIYITYMVYCMVCKLFVSADGASVRHRRAAIVSIDVFVTIRTFTSRLQDNMFYL